MKTTSAIKHSIILGLSISAINANAATTSTSSNLNFSATVPETCQIEIVQAPANKGALDYTGSGIDPANGIEPAYVKVHSNNGTSTRTIQATSISSVSGDKETGADTNTFTPITSSDIKVKYHIVPANTTGSTDLSSVQELALSTDSDGLNTNQKFAVFAKINGRVKAGTAAATVVIQANCS